MKPFWKSKTIIANAFAVLIIAVGAIFGAATGEDLQSLLNGLGIPVGELSGDAVVLILAAVNIGLRFITNQGVTLKPSE